MLGKSMMVIELMERDGQTRKNHHKNPQLRPMPVKINKLLAVDLGQAHLKHSLDHKPANRVFQVDTLVELLAALKVVKMPQCHQCPTLNSNLWSFSEVNLLQEEPEDLLGLQNNSR